MKLRSNSVFSARVSRRTCKPLVGRQLAGNTLVLVTLALAVLASGCSNPTDELSSSARTNSQEIMDDFGQKSTDQSSQGQAVSEGELTPETKTAGLRVSRLRARPPSMAFSRYRWAALEKDQLVVRRIDYAGIFARVEVPRAQTLVSLPGGSFLAVGEEHVYRLSARGGTPTLYRRWSEQSGVQLLPHPAHSKQFSVYHAGRTRIAQYDLGKSTDSELANVGAWNLVGFDGGAVVRLASARLVYTVPGGVARLSEKGALQLFDLPQLRGRIGSLLRAESTREVWAVTEREVLRIELRGEGKILQTVELAPEVIAVQAGGKRIAYLSTVGRASGGSSLESNAAKGKTSGVRQLRLNVHGLLRRQHWTVRLTDTFSSDGSARQKPPELQISPWSNLIAVVGGQTQIFNWRSGRRVYPMLAAGPAVAVNSRPEVGR